MLNESNKDKEYNETAIVDKINGLKIDITPPFDTSKPQTNIVNNPFKFVDSSQGDQDISPKFGKSEPVKTKFLAPAKFEKEDLSKRQKVPVGDGKSQSGFIKLQQDNKNPLLKRVEPQIFTLEEVICYRLWPL